MNGKVRKLSRIGAGIFFLGMLMIVLSGCASNTMAVKETKKDAGQSVESKRIIEYGLEETGCLPILRSNNLSLWPFYSIFLKPIWAISIGTMRRSVTS